MMFKLSLVILYHIQIKCKKKGIIILFKLFCMPANSLEMFLSLKLMLLRCIVPFVIKWVWLLNLL